MKYTIAVTFAILTMNASIAQITELDTVYYNLQGGKASKFENYATYEVGQVDFRERLEGTARRYSKAGRLIEQSEYQKGVKNGKYFRVAPTGKLLLYGEYSEGKKVGLWVTNNVQGLPLKTTYYGKEGNEKEVFEIKEHIYTINETDNLDSSPEYPNGVSGWAKFLRKNLKYPNKSKTERISGTVFLEFIVLSNGLIVNPSVLQSPNQELAAEAMRVLSSSPKWIPAKKNGENVHSFKNIQIWFRIK